MAPPVAAPWGRWVGLGRELLAPSPGRLDMALRLAVICTVTALVGQVYQVPGLDLAVYVVFFLNKSDRMSGVVLAIALTIVLTLASIRGAVRTESSRQLTATRAMLDRTLAVRARLLRAWRKLRACARRPDAIACCR